MTEQEIKKETAIETTVDIATIPDLEIAPSEIAYKTALSFEDIVEVIMLHYGLQWEEVNSTKRRQDFVRARFMIMYFSKYKTTMTLTAIGKKFIGAKNGHLDHSTVMNGIKKVNDYLETNKTFRTEFNEVEGKILFASSRLLTA